MNGLVLAKQKQTNKKENIKTTPIISLEVGKLGISKLEKKISFRKHTTICDFLMSNTQLQDVIFCKAPDIYTLTYAYIVSLIQKSKI